MRGTSINWTFNTETENCVLVLASVFMFDVVLSCFQVLLHSQAWKSAGPSGSIKQLIVDCFRSRAVSTVKRYMKEVVMFLKFQTDRGLAGSFPATVVHLSLYLSLLLGKRKVGAVSIAYAALKWVHGILPVERNPLDCGLCRNLVEAEKRQRTSAVTKKEPASPDLIKAIMSRYGKENSTLKDLRIATMCALSFAGLFRSKELLNIRICDIKVFTDYIIIHVPCSKTDVYRQGQDVFISKSHKESCPGLLLERYLAKAKISVNDSTEYLFKNVIYLKSSNHYILGNKIVSYTRFRELFKECLRELGYDDKQYSLHSFRSGGATTIVKNLKDVSSKERLLKLHGRWKSDIAKDMYVKEDIQERLSVSKSLGL